jgi:hypothetical protein
LRALALALALALAAGGCAALRVRDYPSFVHERAVRLGEVVRVRQPRLRDLQRAVVNGDTWQAIPLTIQTDPGIGLEALAGRCWLQEVMRHGSGGPPRPVKIVCEAGGTVRSLRVRAGVAALEADAEVWNWPTAADWAERLATGRVPRRVRVASFARRMEREGAAPWPVYYRADSVSFRGGREDVLRFQVRFATTTVESQLGAYFPDGRIPAANLVAETDLRRAGADSVRTHGVWLALGDERWRIRPLREVDGERWADAPKRLSEYLRDGVDPDSAIARMQDNVYLRGADSATVLLAVRGSGPEPALRAGCAYRLVLGTGGGASSVFDLEIERRNRLLSLVVGFGTIVMFLVWSTS